MTESRNNDDEWIEWTEIKEIWKNATPGTKEMKNQSVYDLFLFWELRKKEPQPKSLKELNVYESKKMKVTEWLTLAREVIIDKLSKNGIQMRLTSNALYIYCLIRAPMSMLETRADKVIQLS